MNCHDFTLRLRALTRAKRVEKDLDDELAFHIEMQIRKNVAAGMSETEAARQARIQFGRTTQVAEECRDARGIGVIETVWQDIRYAIRGFRRSPTFVLTLVATIAVGLGLDTALFTVFNATYFRPIAVREPGTLYEAFWTDRAGDSQGFSWPEYRQFCSSNPAFSEAFGYIHTEARVNSRTALGTLVTGDYFQVLGIGATLGRTLVPEDTSAPGREPVIMLSYQAWRNRFSGDPDIVGKKVLLRGYPFEVVGVALAGFTGLGSRPVEFWAPLTMSARFESDDIFGPTQPRSLSIVGRLKAGHSVGQTQSALTIWMQRLTSNGPSASKAVRALLFSHATTKPLKIANAFAFSSILAAFSLVLLIGCANVANLMLARSLARQREIGIRLSLGASRGRVVRQLLTESFLLALPSAAAGIAVSEAIIRICVRVLIATLPPGISDFAVKIPQMHVAYAASGISAIVPTPRLCRLFARRPCGRRPRRTRIRHNQRLSKKVSSWSSGRYRPGLTPRDGLCESAFSFNFMSACR
jgi:predicted permease